MASGRPPGPAWNPADLAPDGRQDVHEPDGEQAFGCPDLASEPRDRVDDVKARDSRFGVVRAGGGGNTNERRAR